MDRCAYYFLTGVYCGRSKDREGYIESTPELWEFILYWDLNECSTLWTVGDYEDLREEIENFKNQLRNDLKKEKNIEDLSSLLILFYFFFHFFHFFHFSFDFFLFVCCLFFYFRKR